MCVPTQPSVALNVWSESTESQVAGLLQGFVLPTARQWTAGGDVVVLTTFVHSVLTAVLAPPMTPSAFVDTIVTDKYAPLLAEGASGRDVTATLSSLALLSRSRDATAMTKSLTSSRLRFKDQVRLSRA